MNYSAQNKIIQYGFGESPFGKCMIGVAGDAVCYLVFMDKGSQKENIKDLKNKWPEFELERDDELARKFIKRVFKRDPMNVLMKGTEFEMKVWDALRRIPSGKVSSYGDVARAIDSPNSARAVGSACAKNSIAYIVPCHRVVTQGGKSGSYRWGSDRKQKLLTYESDLIQNKKE